MKCNFFIVSQSGLIDIQSKLATAINIHEDLIAASFPIIIPATVIYSLKKQEDDPNENEVFLRVDIGSTTIIKDYKISILFTGGGQSVKSMTIFGGLLIPHAGELKFELYGLAEIKYAHYSINITTPVPSPSNTFTTTS